VPPRYVYWTILIDQQPTAFRAKSQDDLLPTLHQLRRTNKDVVLKWFARGRLWESPEAELAARHAPKVQEKRGPEWRPGGSHKDPRARFDKRKRPQSSRPPQRDRRPGEGTRPPSGLPARPPLPAHPAHPAPAAHRAFRPRPKSFRRPPHERAPGVGQPPGRFAQKPAGPARQGQGPPDRNTFRPKSDRARTGPPRRFGSHSSRPPRDRRK
jgi:hypothetical protein